MRRIAAHSVGPEFEDQPGKNRKRLLFVANTVADVSKIVHDLSMRAVVRLLREADEECELAGAAVHGYQMAPPLEAAFIERYEHIHQVTLPDSYRRFIAEEWSSGVGPHRGLLPLNKPVAGALGRCLRLADQGDGVWSLLVLEGDHAGQVWAGELFCEARTFAAWVEQWTLRAMREAAHRRLPFVLAGPHWQNDPLIDAAATAIELLAAAATDLRQSVRECELLRTLGYLRIYQRRYEDALALFARASECDEAAPMAEHALARARYHRARGEKDAWLTNALSGLQEKDCTQSVCLALLAEKRAALFALDRDEEAILASEELALHSGQIFDVFDTAWHRIERDEIALAARWLSRCARQGIGCAKGSRPEIMAIELFHALEQDEQAEQAKALRERLRILATD